MSKSNLSRLNKQTIIALTCDQFSWQQKKKSLLVCYYKHASLTAKLGKVKTQQSTATTEEGSTVGQIGNRNLWIT